MRSARSGDEQATGLIWRGVCQGAAMGQGSYGGAFVKGVALIDRACGGVSA
jgi:hypothetical protein